MRVGWGYDAHRFADEGVLLVAGVAVDGTRGVEATSDGDVLAHAVCDALLGACALGDLGSMFPSDDPAWQGADSMGLLAAVVERVRAAGWAPASLDATVVLEGPRLAPHREAMRSNLAATLGLKVEVVSVKATTTDRLGFVGRGEGLAAMALVTVEHVARST